MHYSVAAGAKDSLIQLVSFGSGARGGGTGTAEVSLRIPEAHRSVTLHTLDAEPAPLQPVTVGPYTEYRLPQFGIYSALEVKA